VCFLFSLFPATVLTVFGYLVLYCATKSEGGVSTFGRILAAWVFVLAAIPPLAGAYVSIAGLCPVERALERMR
jgi:hypothetical protein